MSTIDYILIIAVIFCVICAVRGIIVGRKKGIGCSGDCANCGVCNKNKGIKL